MQIFANRLKRSKRSVLSEVEIGNKIIKIPTYFPKVKCKLDFTILLSYTNLLEYQLQGICFNIKDVEKLLSPFEIQSYQTDLFNLRPIDNEEFALKNLLQTRLLIIDPQMEVFYYDKMIDENRSYKSEILRLLNFSKEVKSILMLSKSKNHNQIWKDLVQHKYLIPVINQYLLYQNKFNPDIIVPPTPVIDANSLKTLEVAYMINKFSIATVRDRMEALPAVYLPILYRAVKKRGFLDIIFERFKELFLISRIVILKLMWYDYLVNDDIAIFSEFLSKIDELKKDLADEFLVIYLDGGNEGIYTLGNGVDIYIEPMDGVTKYEMRRGKDIDEEEVDKMLGITENKYGKYYLKDIRKHIAFSELIKILEDNGGILPCNCKSCKELHRKLPHHISTEKWNIHRRLHLINARLEEIEEKLKPWIIDDMMDEMRLYALNDSNKNHIYLLPKYPLK